MRTIAVVTGTRAEYGLLRSTMAAIDAHPALTLRVVVTGMHLSPTHGRTVDAIRADGFDIDRTVLMQLEGDSGAAMAASVGTGMVGMTTALESLAPHAVVVLGDRGEPFAAAVVAAHLRIPVAHLHGGDMAGGAKDLQERNLFQSRLGAYSAVVGQA